MRVSENGLEFWQILIIIYLALKNIPHVFQACANPCLNIKTNTLDNRTAFQSTPTPFKIQFIRECRKVRLDVSQSLHYIRTTPSKLTNKEISKLKYTMKSNIQTSPVPKKSDSLPVCVHIRVHMTWQPKISSDIQYIRKALVHLLPLCWQEHSDSVNLQATSPRTREKSVGIVSRPSGRTACISHHTMPCSIAFFNLLLLIIAHMQEWRGSLKHTVR